jgi:hypothetical protein
MIQNQENYYWLFSSSAQTISAFVAFLVTGFALVLNMLDSLQAKDESLEEIHTQLKSNYYRKIRILAIITGLAIIFSLWMVYLNGGTFEHKWWLYILAVGLNFAAVVFGILFVISIINPERYKTAAIEIIKKDRQEFSITGSQIDQLSFMTEFIKLERKVRNILKDRDLFVPYGETPKMMYSFRQMVNSLYQNELISRSDLNDLLQINKYRNLVFHGHQEQVDKGMLDRVKEAEKIIENISKRNGS